MSDLPSSNPSRQSGRFGGLPRSRTELLARLFGVEVYLINQIWDDLQALRPLWPILLPVVIWYAQRTFRRERVAAKAAARALENLEN